MSWRNGLARRCGGHALRYTLSMLAPYALRAEESRGRRYPEEAHAYRNVFQRDRDRVVHSRLSAGWKTRRRSLPAGALIIFATG